MSPDPSVSARICGKRSGLKDGIDLIQTKYRLEGASAGAELMRLSRNHVVHGDDSTPLSGGSTTVRISMHQQRCC